jgi:SNF2 family DNA or RNA helicase
MQQIALLRKNNMSDPSNDLLQHYNKLTPFEQTLLQFQSIVYEPAHSTLIVNCLRKLDIRSPRGNRPTAANLNHYFSKFQETGLLTKEKQCAPLIVEKLSRIAVEEGSFAEYAKVVRKEAPVSYYYGKWTTRCWRAMREMRIGIYTQDFDLIDDALEFLGGQCRDILSPLPPTVQVTTRPFDPVWFRSIPPSFQFFLLDSIAKYELSTLHHFPEILLYLEEETSLEERSSDEMLPFQRLLLTQYVFRGQLDKAEELISENYESFSGTGASGTLAFLRGNSEETEALFEHDLDFLRDLSGTENAAFFGPTGLFHGLATLQNNQSDEEQKVLRQIGIALSLFSGSVEEKAYQAFAGFLQVRSSHALPGEEMSFHKDDAPHSLTILFTALGQYWLNSSLQPEVSRRVETLYKHAQANGFHFFSLNLAAILAGVGQNEENYEAIVQQLQEETGLSPLINILASEEPWKRNLQALIQVTASSHPSNTLQTERLIWMVDYINGIMRISPKEQKQGATGNWSKGRPISLSRLYSGKLNYLSVQDRKISACIEKRINPETHGTSYHFDMDKTLIAMVNHPLLFFAKSPGTPVEFVSGEPELMVEERGSQLHICFAQEVTEDKITIFQETPTRYKIIEINDNHRRIAQITGKNGLIVPMDASEQVLTAIGNISSFMTVHSAIAADIDNHAHASIERVEADSTIYMHLLPYGTGFRLEMFVKPFINGGHYLKPGQGVENIIAEVRGQRLQTKRDLGLEEEKAREVEESCPILDLAIDLEQENDREWHLQDPDDCLQALQELQTIQDQVIIEWPEGEKLHISHQASLKNLNLKVRTNQQNWFSLSGELKLDQDTVIDLRELLKKVKNAHGHFVQIKDGQFLALTQEFKKKLEEINLYAEGMSEKDDNNEVLIHHLAAIPLEKLVEQAKAEVDDGWKEQIKRIHDSQSFKPQLPSTLRAELRDYQEEGFHWLSRLAHWGVGGCLADDMGLGKTIQALTAMLSLASDGPSLVVAPTSVSSNWQSEANRFTPTLNVKLLMGKNRAEIIAGLGKFDILITTYTLLQQENDLLSAVHWQTVILDEAQAIKNAATKRSKAAMALNAKFKLITTGTPVENHLGELWNLFHFINPGLLGTLNRFNERFAIPIERYHNRDARLKLKKLIRPFILRRIKSQVLEELPSRTEITLDVELSEEETLFYEALRQNALEVLENNQEKKARHLQILTEIMKLRQACCNPRLITKDTNIGSAKLKVFASVIDELLAGGHKALIFSQFIGHLSILREHLDNKGIDYRYLDGSTSSPKRKQQVDRFQAGEGDLFLISLKAGGLGLNLTAADYVIHMDPWWNPAIEDQASDRAHRIGQTRPVTIYRLVCKNTIEEKIVRLHQEKRDLAGSLLEGSDMSAKMSSEDLLDLIRRK